MSRLHSYSTIPTPLGEQTPEQTELRHQLGLGRPFWKDIVVAMAGAAAGAITTSLVFDYFNRRRRKAKGRKR